jgi:hypothetical protein
MVLGGGGGIIGGSFGGGSCICVGTNINIGGVIKIVVLVSAEEAV